MPGKNNVSLEFTSGTTSAATAISTNYNNSSSSSTRISERRGAKLFQRLRRPMTTMGEGSATATTDTTTRAKQRHCWGLLLVHGLLFTVLVVTGLLLINIQSESVIREAETSALALASETGLLMSEALDKAMMPLFSLAQFAVEIPLFRDLAEQIGPAGHNGSLPMAPPQKPAAAPSHRNITNSACTNPAVVQRFNEIAATVKRNANLPTGVLVTFFLVPELVICLAHPLVNHDDFPPGISFNAAPSLGMDFATDPRLIPQVAPTLTANGMYILGPITLRQCLLGGTNNGCDPVVEKAFIARVPIRWPNHTITVPYPPRPRENDDDDGGNDNDSTQQTTSTTTTTTRTKSQVFHDTWGFAGVTINWEALVDSLGLNERFETTGHEFLLTRTDQLWGDTTEVVVLAQSPKFHSAARRSRKYRSVQATLLTINREWDMTVKYNVSGSLIWKAWAVPIVVLISLLLAYLSYTVLAQKQMHTEQLSLTRAQHQAALETERKMTSYFSHELRNPIGAIDSAISAMPEEDLPEAAKDLLSGMQLCTTFMSGVMNNLLDVRQMEEGKMSLRRGPLELDALVMGVYNMLLPSVKEGVELRYHCHENCLGPRRWVMADVHRLQQVLTNIVSNSLKYTLAGSVTLSVQWVDEDEENDQNGRGNNNHHRRRRVRFECTDTGPGIPKEEQPDLFKRFVKRGGAPGSGLGLAISKHIVDLMNGEIYFESDPTVQPGATCVVLLSLEECVEAETAGAADGYSSSSGSSTAKQQAIQETLIEQELSFLIVDDLKINRMMLKKRFEKGVAPRCRITEASTGEEALEICQRQSFDVIIVDQFMQGAGGVLLGTDTIIAMRRMGVSSLIIGCSGNEMDNEFKSAGAVYVWKKPMPSNSEIIQQLRNGLAATVPIHQFEL